MDADDLGSVSRALRQGGDENREYVIARSIELYADLWSSIAKGILPPHRRRPADHEDALQETLRELDRILRRPDHSLRTREDLRRLGTRILTCNAKDVLEVNLEHDGPSVVRNAGRVQSSSSADDSLPDALGRSDKSASPGAAAEASEIQSELGGFEQTVAVRLGALGELDRRIVERWLEWKSFRGIAAELGVTLRDVRNTTFDFKTWPQLARLSGELRLALAESEASEAGVLNRVNISPSTGRLLCDFREES